MKKLIIAALVAVPLLTGCETLRGLANSSLSDADRQELVAHQANIEALEAMVAELEDEAEGSALAVAAAVKAGDAQGVSDQVTRFLDLQRAHQAVVNEYGAAVEDEREIISKGTSSVVGGFLQMAGPFIPAPFQPLIPFASSLAVLALSTRARKHAGKALAATMRGNLGAAAASVLKALGAKHSNDTPAGVMEGAVVVAQAAVASGDMTSEQLAEITALQEKLAAG